MSIDCVKPFSLSTWEPRNYYMDKYTTLACKFSICSNCNEHVMASNTTNLRTRQYYVHKDMVIKELKANETLEFGRLRNWRSWRLHRVFQSIYRLVYMKSGAVRSAYLCLWGIPTKNEELHASSNTWSLSTAFEEYNHGFINDYDRQSRKYDEEVVACVALTTCSTLHIMYIYIKDSTF